MRVCLHAYLLQHFLAAQCAHQYKMLFYPSIQHSNVRHSFGDLAQTSDIRMSVYCEYTDVIQLLFIYLLNGPASLNTLYAIWTLAIIDGCAYTVQHFEMSFAP